MANLELNNRSPRCERLPDERLRVTRIYDIANNKIPNDPAKLLAIVWLDWATPDEEFPDCRLIAQNVSGQDGPFRQPVQEPPILTRVYEEIPENDRSMVGEPNISFDQYGNKTTVIEYVQFSSGSTVYTDEVGVTPAPAPNAACLLKTLESTNDGTLIRSKLTFIDSGELSDTQELRFGGRVVVRQITSLGVPPATPAGWSLVTQSIEFSQGRQVYRYGFVNGGGGGGGAGGAIGVDTQYGQTITEGVTQGTTTVTIKYISDTSVTTNPITTPVGFNLIDVSYSDDTGYRLWTATYAKGTGTVGLQTEAREDGSFVYDIETLSMFDSNPAYPGTGTGYNTEVSHAKVGGYVVNRSKWIKPPPTVTYRRQMEWDNPGLAYFVGTDLILQPGARMQKLGFVEVSFGTTQDTSDPFFVQQWAGFIETYTPTDTGVAINNQFGLNGYLATGNSSSGTGMYKGVDCVAWSYQRFASIPDSLPSGLTKIAVNNSPYLVDINGTMVFRRVVESVNI